MAHALGGLESESGSYIYTNSREAFLEHYNKGTRVFEVDIVLSSDGQLVCQHAPDGRTRDEFMQSMVNGLFTPLDFEALTDLFTEYSDAYIVTDTKYTDEENIKKQFRLIYEICMQKNETLLNRIIPQLYHEPMYGWLEEIYPFPEYIYTLYAWPHTLERVGEFVREHDKITAVTMWWDMRAWYTALSGEAGKRVYVHTVNDIEHIKSMYAEGVHGFYTDFITEDALREGGLPPYAPEN